MAINGQMELVPVQAKSDLSAQSSRFKVVTLNGVLWVGGANAGQPAGVLISSARSGELASVCVKGIPKVVYGGAVNTLGYPLTVASGGFLVACASGGFTVGRQYGPDLPASGDLGPALLDFSTMPAFVPVV